MTNYSKEIEELRLLIEEVGKMQSSLFTDELGLRTYNLLSSLNEENKLLRKKLTQMEKDIEWMENQLNKWMVKAMENSQK
ncbi:hypothetical protein ABE096_21335 [Robertmurraya massiliosenegalensis]|uniref:hypothetical protein n=1 Tax=Robertmurraya TaxID=2837507 RepID=UPI0039A5A55D